jgi:hypothetical protein
MKQSKIKITIGKLRRAFYYAKWDLKESLSKKKALKKKLASLKAPRNMKGIYK